MHRQFIALVLSGSLALTGLSTQAAKADDTAEWIAGAAALAIIGLAIADANKKPKPSYNPTPYTYAPSPNYHKILPRQCRTRANMQGHVIRGLGKRCLKRAGVNVHALPGHCEVRVRDPYNGKRKIIYGGRCLRQNGYELARAH